MFLNLLIINTLLSYVFPTLLKSQISNRLAYNSILIDHFNQDTNKIGKITGFLAEFTKAHAKTFSGSELTLEVETPRVDFQRIGKGQFQRTISIDLIYKDSSETRTALNQIDTLRRQDISEARKVEEKVLRGPDPRFLRKFLLPMVGIGGGIAGIISLFYIRSS